jgi:YVTN family beta-propeller protein
MGAMFVSVMLLAALGQGTLVVLNKAEGTAALIDLRKGEVAATVTTGKGPHEVAVSPDGRRALVTNYGDQGAPGNTLTLIDVASAKVVKTIDLGEHRRPHGVAYLESGRALVTSEASRALLVVDVEAGTVLKAIPTDQDVSHMVAASRDGRRAFVANIGSGSVTVLDVEKGAVVTQVTTGAGAEGIALSPDGSRVWVSNRAADTVSVLDARDGTVVETIPSRAFPIRVRLTPDGRHALVSNARSGDVAILDAKAMKEVGRLTTDLRPAETEARLLPFGGSPVPIGIVVAPDGRHGYVAFANADTVVAYDLKTRQVVGTVKPGREPDGMAYAPVTVTPTAP